MSGSEIFRAGEAGMGFAEEAVLYTFLSRVTSRLPCLLHVCKKEKYEDLSLKQLRETETKLEAT